MKIIFFSNSFWNLYNFRRPVIENCIKFNHEIVLVAGKDNFFYNTYFSKFKKFSINIISNKISPFSDILFLLSSIYIIYKVKPDLIINYTIKPNIYTSIAGKLFNIRVINNFTGLGTIFFIKNFILKYLLNLILIFSQKNVNTICFHNKFDKNYFIKNKIIFENQAIVIPGSGIDINYFDYIPFKKTNLENLQFIFIGRLIKEKGIYEYLEAAKNIKSKFEKINFVIVGDIDPNNPSSISKAKILEFIDKKIIKYFSFQENVKIFLKKSDCLILPSYREGLSKILLESCLMGIPVITTDVPGCADVVINNYNGLLCKAQDTNNLIARINDFMNYNLKERESLSINARKYVESKFSNEIIVSKYENIINNNK